MYMYTYIIHVYIYIYIYILFIAPRGVVGLQLLGRVRAPLPEPRGDGGRADNLYYSCNICVYIYIYIHTHIYIYIYRERERLYSILYET